MSSSSTSVDECFKRGLVAGCFESVSVVQVACHTVCAAAGIAATQDERILVGQGLDPSAIVKAVVDKQSAR